MSEYIVDALWMAEYERGIESLLGVKLEYDGNDNPTPPLPRRNIIVRCRDCRHCVIYETWNPKGETYHCNSFGQDIDPDGFCAWGCRK